MDPMKILQGRVKAAETSYFKPEMENQITRRRDQLLKEGRLQSVTMPDVRRTWDVLPEILSHELPLDFQRTKVLNSKGYSVARPSQSEVARFANEWSRPSIYDSLGATELNSARRKWSSHVTEGKSIFDIRAAHDLMQADVQKKSVDKSARLVNVGPKPVAPQTIRIAGVPVIALPEPTAGRALLWGTILAIWAGSATATYTCRALDINSIADVGPKFKEALQPLGEFMQALGTDVKTKVVASELEMDTSSFSYKLRETIAG